MVSPILFGIDGHLPDIYDYETPRIDLGITRGGHLPRKLRISHNIPSKGEAGGGIEKYGRPYPTASSPSTQTPSLL
jgi:hypothetical protein